MAPYHETDGAGGADDDYCSEELDDCAGGITLDNFDERNAEPPILMSPRSIEACRMLGIDPGDLVQRPLEYFVTKSGSARAVDDVELAEKRALRYERNRQTQLRSARAQRHELVDAGLSGASLRTGSIYRSPLGESRHSVSTTIEREKKELERMQQRQVAEMQQLLAFELRMADLHEERQRKEAETRRQEELLARERTRRQRESDELKRRRELERAEQHKLELELARKEALEVQAEALQKEQRARKEDERRRREAQLAEKERARRQEELRAQSDVVHGAQLREAEHKALEIARRDERRRQQLEAAKRAKALEVAAKQQRNKLRVSSVLQDKEALHAAQQREAARKQQVSEERRRQFDDERRLKEDELRLEAQRKKEAIDAVQQQLQLREQQRRARLEQQERDAARRLRAKELERHAERAELKLAELQQEDERRRAYERMEQQLRLKRETYAHRADEKARATRLVLEQQRRSMRSRLDDAKLREEEIQAALARRQRADAYRLERLEARLASDDERARALKAQREGLVRRRQQLQQSASRHKREILDSFYRMKVTKKLELPAHLAASLSASTADGVSVERPRHRPASAFARPRSTSTPPRHDDDASRRRRHSDEPDVSRSLEAAANNEMLDDALLRAEIDALRRAHNAELLQVLEDEHHAEEQREHLALHARDAGERERLERVFSKERARASERIMTVTQTHERALTARIRELQGAEAVG